MKEITIKSQTAINIEKEINSFWLAEKEKKASLVSESDKKRLLKIFENIEKISLDNPKDLKTISLLHDKRAFEVVVFLLSFEGQDEIYNYSDILTLFLSGINSKVEKRHRELYLFDMLGILAEKLPHFKEWDLENYIFYLKNKVQHVESAASTTKLSETGKELSTTGRDRNIVYDFLEDMSLRYGFLFSQSSRNIATNIRVINSVMKNEDFIPEDYIAYIKSNPNFDKWIDWQMTELNKNNEQIYILWFTCLFLYPFFYTGGEISTIRVITNWFEWFVVNYETAINSAQLTSFYFKEILGKKTLRKNELWIFFQKNKGDIHAILTFVDNNLEAGKDLLRSVSEWLKKRGLNISIPFIAKNMYDTTLFEKKISVANKRRKVVKTRTTVLAGDRLKQLSERNYPEDFILEMKRRKIPKMFYSDYYKEYENWKLQ